MNIVIVGGGTSGLVTAALFNVFWKDKVNISLYYNPENQSIGVGEGTTPSFIDVFNETLGYSTEDAIRELDATIKLGVLFKDWIPDTEYYHGFVEVANDETNNRSDKLSSNVSSFYSMLNGHYNGGINFNEATNTIPTELDKHDFAFHITTNKLCDFLIEDSKTVMLIPVFISREEKKVKSFSVGKFPIKELPAIGQPPMPSIAPSNRRQPESKAAEIF